MTTYRGLILDFGGVVTTRMRANGEAFEASEGLAAGAYFDALERNPDGVRVYSALEVGEATQTDWNRIIGGILGVDPDNLMERALGHLQLEPEIVEVVVSARGAGIKTAMLSNSFGIEPFDVYAKLGAYDLFDVVVLSEVERVRKPSSAIYKRALELLKLDGEECVFVDDHAANLPPAEALGMTTIHHTDPEVTAARLRAMLS